MIKKETILLNVYVALISICSFSNCTVKSTSETYTIKGRLIDGSNPSNKFSNIKMVFVNITNTKKYDVLGETETNSNGEFSFSYDFPPGYESNFLEIKLDTSIIAAQRLKFIELGQSWDKTFYLGDSAKFNLFVNEPLEINDTLYIQYFDSLYKIKGPKQSGFVETFKCTNYNPGGIIGYGVGYNNYFKNSKIENFNPTGEPIVDVIHLNISN